MWVRGDWTSLTMSVMDRQYTTYCWSSIVTLALAYAIFELIDVEYMTLISMLGFTEGDPKQQHSIDCIQVPIPLPL